MSSMKKGFTLIEMLAVIVILTIVSLIIFPEVNKMIKNSKQKSYDRQISNLIDAAKKVVVKDTNLLPSKELNNKVCLTLYQLLQAGEIETDVISDPRNPNNRIEGVIVISYSQEYDTYVYSYNETCPNAPINNNPVINNDNNDNNDDNNDDNNETPNEDEDNSLNENPGE